MRREHEQITTDYNKMIIKLEEIVKRHEKLQEENKKLKSEQTILNKHIDWLINTMETKDKRITELITMYKNAHERLEEIKQIYK